MMFIYYSRVATAVGKMEKAEASGLVMETTGSAVQELASFLIALGHDPLSTVTIVYSEHQNGKLPSHFRLSLRTAAAIPLFRIYDTEQRQNCLASTPLSLPIKRDALKR